MTAPAGWTSAPDAELSERVIGIYTHPALKARIVVQLVESGTDTAESDAVGFGKYLTARYGVTIGPVSVSPDGKTAWCTATQEEVLGLIRVRHLGRNDIASLIALANYGDAANEAAVNAALTSVVGTATAK